MAQTYKNCELLFVDDNSKDNTITLIMDLKDEAKIRREDYSIIDRIKVSQTVTDRGESVNRNSSYREARGRWIAVLDENLATMRTPFGVFCWFLRTDKVKWHYEVY